ncbi:hypothetical protein ACFWOJ_11965 [Streptomyces sp. NPDC058439]|uniref:hypothetical protein n=1 Tax=Streptomyces sp. NPDC058439 TaxID=3346500 RepID=UPI0036589CEA
MPAPGRGACTGHGRPDPSGRRTVGLTGRREARFAAASASPVTLVAVAAAAPRAFVASASAAVLTRLTSATAASR